MVCSGGGGMTADTVFTWLTAFSDSLCTCMMTAAADSGTVALAAQGTGIAQADRGSTATVTMSARPRKDEEVAKLFSSGENHGKGVFFDRDRL